MKLLTQRKVAGITTCTLGVIIAGVLFTQHSCSARQTSQNVKRYPHTHVAPAEYEANAKSNALRYTVSEGDTLERIATSRYDHRYYDRIIKLSNHIEDESKVKAGADLRLPNLMDVLTEEEFTKEAAYESQLILCSRAKYRRVKNPLWALRGAANRDRIVVPEDYRLALLEAASDLEEAIDGLRANKPGVTQSPRSMIGQLEQNAGTLRELAEGANDGYGYDLDIVDQRYALALSYGVLWARAGFK